MLGTAAPQRCPSPHLARPLARYAHSWLVNANVGVAQPREEGNVQPILDRILTLNLIGTTLVFYVAARLYVLPRLGELAPRTVLLPILLLHSLRHLGLMFLTRGAVYPGLPPQFAYPAALGDLLAAFLAFASIAAVIKDWKVGRPLVWVFNIFGTLDLFVAITLGAIYQASITMGPAYWIPAFWVPAMLVTHYITFIVLRKHWV